ncbi:MAG: ribosome maturation factor RimM [Deltaproteobacteria bacterium]|nr:ribosome maturation factor RimM [Deltaproteobacteria bacterium]
MPDPELIAMGRAAGAFGLRGELRVWSFASEPEVFLRAGQVWIGPEPGRVKAYTPLAWRPHHDRVLLKLAEVTDRDQAAALTGSWLYLSREVMAPLAEGEYYWADLKGKTVRTAAGQELGRVVGVSDAGAHDLLLIRDGEGHEALVPVVEDVVLDLGLSGGEIVVSLPEGLLEAQDWPE